MHAATNTRLTYAETNSPTFGQRPEALAERCEREGLDNCAATIRGLLAERDARLPVTKLREAEEQWAAHADNLQAVLKAEREETLKWMRRALQIAKAMEAKEPGVVPVIVLRSGVAPSEAARMREEWERLTRSAPSMVRWVVLPEAVAVLSDEDRAALLAEAEVEKLVAAHAAEPEPAAPDDWVGRGHAEREWR